MQTLGIIATAIALGGGSSLRAETEGSAAAEVIGATQVGVLAAASQDGISFYQLLDEMLNELAGALRELDANDISPVALRKVDLSSNLSTELEAALAARLNAKLTDVPGLSQVECIACFTVKTRIDGGDWVVTRGITSSADTKRVGRTIGAKAFVDAALEYIEGTERLVLTIRLVRAEDSAILLAEQIESDHTKAALVRDGRRAQTLDERRAELETLLMGRPTFGHAAIVGFMRIPYETPEFNQGIAAITVHYRLYELFGEGRANLFGLQMGGFYDPNLNQGERGKIPTAGGTFTAVYLRSLLPDDQRLPVLRLGATVGGLIGGSIGNTAMAGAMVEIMMRWRLAAQAGVYYVIPVDVEQFDGRLGGFSYSVAGSFNWE